MSEPKTLHGPFYGCGCSVACRDERTNPARYLWRHPDGKSFWCERCIDKKGEIDDDFGESLADYLEEHDTARVLLKLLDGVDEQWKKIAEAAIAKARGTA